MPDEEPLLNHSGPVSVATISWSRSPAEEVLLRRSLSLLAATGLPIAIADRGTSAPFRDFLHGLSGVRVTTPAEDGLVAQVQASMDLASAVGCPFILYVEPDKELFFRDGLRMFVHRALQNPRHGVVLAARSDGSFETYPRMQRYTEGVVNHLCGEILQVAGDYSYGPFLLSRELLPAIASLDGDLGWGWRPSMFVSARRLGLDVRHVIGHHRCPPEQQVEDESERRHRLRQLSQNIMGILT